MRLQISEFAKLAMVFGLAHYLALNQTRIHELVRGFVAPLAWISVFAGLILLEPDFGTAALTFAIGVIAPVPRRRPAALSDLGVCRRGRRS